MSHALDLLTSFVERSKERIYGISCNGGIPNLVGSAELVDTTAMAAAELCSTRGDTTWFPRTELSRFSAACMSGMRSGKDLQRGSDEDTG